MFQPLFYCETFDGDRERLIRTIELFDLGGLVPLMLKFQENWRAVVCFSNDVMDVERERQCLQDVVPSWQAWRAVGRSRAVVKLTFYTLWPPTHSPSETFISFVELQGESLVGFVRHANSFVYCC